MDAILYGCGVEWIRTGANGNAPCEFSLKETIVERLLQIIEQLSQIACELEQLAMEIKEREVDKEIDIETILREQSP